jgi:transketolase
MRETCLAQVYELAKTDDRIFFIGSDLGVGTLDQFKREMPGRFIMEGVSEQHVVGMASGLALEGRIVYVNTISTFLTRRCFEQVVVDMCLHNLNVRLIGNGGGLVYAPLGPTHLAIEDISILRAVPNMTIVAPADADEMRRLMPQTVDHQGPMYIRLAKGHDPIVSRDDVPFRIGKALPMREGADALIVTTGITLKFGLEAARELSAQGVECAVLHVPTVKPLDSAVLLERVRATPIVVVIEENTRIGGLGSAVAELMVDADVASGTRLRRIGIPDRFADHYGSQADLLAHYGISTAAVVAMIHELRTVGAN